MLKGHAKIELTNVKTGEVKTYEHDNFITNLFRDAMQPCGAFGSLREYFQTNKMTTDAAILSMAEGVVLFDGKPGETADDYVVPAGINQVGRASNVAYSGADTSRGSFSTSESVVTGPSYKFVWDFTTKQANGTIASVCLCSPHSANLGFGQMSTDSTDSQYFFSKELKSNSEPMVYPYYNTASASRGRTWFDEDNNQVLVVTSGLPNNGGKGATGNLYYDKQITITAFRVPINSCSIYDSYNASERTSNTGEKTYTVTMPDELQTVCDDSIYQGWTSRIDQENATLSILMFPGSQGIVSAGGTIYNWIIDLKDMSSTVKTYTNNTGYDVGSSNTSGGYQYIFELENYIILLVYSSTDGRKVFSISKDDGTCTEFKMMDGTDIPWYRTAGDSYYLSNYICIGDLMYFGAGYYLGDFNRVYVFDAKLATLKVLNDTNSWIWYYESGNALTFGGKRKYMAFDARNNRTELLPYVLFTINNLDSPIEKTDEQAMKITYTLTKQ